MNTLAAALTAFCVSVVAATLLAFPCGGLNGTVAAASLATGAICGIAQYALYRRKRVKPHREKPGPWEWFVIVAGALFSLRAFLWLLFRNEDKLEIISPNNLGDLALHITYIKNLANGVPFWPQNPIYAGEGLHYPLGVDVFNSLLLLAGVDLQTGLVWVGLLGCAATGIAMYRWGRGFGLAGLLFNGGLAGFLIFKTWHLEDYQAEIAWKSIPLSMFVTQRGLLYAIPAGLALLWSWRRRFFPEPENDGEPPLPFAVELLLYSTMPLFHLHTFIFLSLLCGCWLVVAEMPKKIAVLKLLACSFLPATMLVALITGYFQSKSIVHFDWDWMYGEQSQFGKWAAGLGLPPLAASAAGHIACWAVNYGVLPLLIFALVDLVSRNWKQEPYRRAAAFVIPSVAIYVFSYFVMLAPWSWDNTKIMIWPYFALLPFLWERMISKWNSWPRVFACFILFFPGFVTLFGGIDGSHTGYEFATPSEIDGVAVAVRGISPTAVFAAFPTFNHPLLLNGRIVVAGYPGHLWSHGIDYQDRMDMLESLMRGEDDWKLTAIKLRAHYLYWGEREQHAYGDSTQPWKNTALKVAEGPWGAIYDLDAAAKAK